MQYITLISGIICCLLTFSMGAEKNVSRYPGFLEFLPEDVSEEMLKIVDPTGWINPVVSSTTASCILGYTVLDEDDLEKSVLPVEECCSYRMDCIRNKIPM